MRIIAGEFRGRRLLPPAGPATRPITDRAKQSLFDILAPQIPGAVVYDLFAGTGSMGLECVSRGAARVVFFEANRSAVSLLRRNIELLAVGGQSRVIGGDLFAWFASPDESVRPDLVFLDPPYAFVRERTADLLALADRLAAQLSPAGIVVFRHDARDRLAFPRLKPVDARQYGNMSIEFLRQTDG